MSLRIRRWSAAIDPRIPLLDHGPNRSISAGSTAGKGNVRKGFANSRGKARGKSFGPVSLHVCAGLEQTLKRATKARRLNDRQATRGSNPAHGDAARKSLATQRAEVFALPQKSRSHPIALSPRRRLALTGPTLRRGLCRSTSSWLSGGVVQQRHRRHIDEYPPGPPNQRLPGPHNRFKLIFSYVKHHLVPDYRIHLGMDREMDHACSRCKMVGNTDPGN